MNHTLLSMRYLGIPAYACALLVASITLYGPMH